MQQAVIKWRISDEIRGNMSQVGRSNCRHYAKRNAGFERQFKFKTNKSAADSQRNKQ